MSKVETTAQIAEVLKNNGYTAVNNDDSVSVLFGTRTNPISAIVNIIDKNMYIAVQLAKLGDLRRKDFNKAMFAMLASNNSVLPYAFDIQTASDNSKADKAEKWPITLINSVPVGDLSEEELIAAFDSLRTALVTAAGILKPYLKKVV
jgi:hypothetical protein